LAVQALNSCVPGYCRSPSSSITQIEEDPNKVQCDSGGRN